MYDVEFGNDKNDDDKIDVNNDNNNIHANPMQIKKLQTYNYGN